MSDFLNQCSEVLADFFTSITKDDHLNDLLPEEKDEIELDTVPVINDVDLPKINDLETSEESDEENLDEIESSYTKFYSEINSLQDTFFYLLHCSLLSGEYISNNKALSTIDAIKDQILTAEKELFIFDSGGFLNGTFNLILKALKSYSHFINEVLKLYEQSISDNYLSDYSFSVSSNHKVDDYPTFYFIDDEHYNFFEVNVKICRLDHFNSCTDFYLEDLYGSKEKILEFKRPVFEEIVKVIIYKIDFLAKKWILRKQSDVPNAGSYSLDGIEQQWKITYKFYGAYSEWINYLTFHYEIDQREKNAVEIRKKKIQAASKGFSNLTLLEIHSLIKLYKDDKKDFAKLEEIEKHLGTIDLHTLKCDFDRYVFKLAKNYAANNLFSLRIKDEKNINKIVDYFKGAINAHYVFRPNPFLHSKFIEKVVDVILSNRDNKNFEQLINEFNYIDSTFDDLILQYKKYFNWSKNHHNYIFLLPFDECLVEPHFVVSHNNVQLSKIFIASSFILPVNTENLEAEYNDNLLKYQNLEIFITTLGSLDPLLNKIEVLNEAAKDREMRNIEVIGIFTAIITFVLASVPAYKFIDTFFESILFVIATASSMCLFIIVLFGFTKGSKNYERIVLPALILLCIVIFNYRFLVSSDFKSVVKEHVVTKQDSLKKKSDRDLKKPSK